MNKLMLIALIGAAIIVAEIGVTYVVFLQPKVYTVTLSKIGNGDLFLSRGRLYYSYTS